MPMLIGTGESVTKTKRKLQLVEESLKLKLELRSIKEQFLNLLENFDDFDHRQGSEEKVMGKMECEQSKPMSAARARVRALYDAKRARLKARRESKLHQQLPCVQDKENQDVNIIRDDAHLGFLSSAAVATSTPHAGKDTLGSQKHPAFRPKNVLQKILTPIREELKSRRHSRKSSVSSTRSTPCTKNLPPVCVRQSLSDREGASDYGDYVTLSGDCGDYVTLSGPAPKTTPQKHMPHDLASNSDNTSVWTADSPVHRLNAHNNSMELSATTYDGSPSNRLGHNFSKGSPVQYASSNVISKVYTNKSIRDISQISRIASRTSLREQVSSSNMSGAFHSTFNYPLHSTLNYPNMHCSLEAIEPVEKTPTGAGDRSGVSDTRTTISEPSVLEKNTQLTVLSKPRAIDDSYVDDYRSLQQTETSLDQNRNVYETPKNQVSKPKLQPQLCKEHGLHPTFGGPCIFMNDDDSFTMADDDSLEEDEVAHNPSLRMTATTTETDCDSSYLSECMDDASHYNQEFSETDEYEYTATYDARFARMKMLRRQTGQTQLKGSAIRYPVGLSESSMFDTTNKHLSLEATRASLPDLSALSTPSSNDTYDRSDMSVNSTLQSSILHHPMPNRSRDRNDTLIGPDNRPLSIATTASTNADTSPESNTLTVPVNSPNITDTGSSSKTNTDNYDYVDMPPPKVIPPQLPSHCLYQSSYVTKPSRRRHANSNRAPSSSGRISRSSRKSAHYRGDSASSCSGTSSIRRSSRRTQSRHLVLSGLYGTTRTVVQHAAVAKNLQHDRKKQLAKKLKQFNNKMQSTGNLHIRTLGHF